MFASQTRGEQPGKVPCSLPARTKIKALAAGGAVPAQWQWTVGKDIMAYFLGNLLPNPKKEEKKKKDGGEEGALILEIMTCWQPFSLPL